MVRLATVSLASGIAFGVTSQLYSRRRTGRLVPRWLHQTSLTSSLVFLGVSAWSQRRTSMPAAAAHGAALLVLSTLPLTSAGRPNHIGVASAASVLHAVGVFVSRRGRPRISLAAPGGWPVAPDTIGARHTWVGARAAKGSRL